jgi:heme/copper-type cytochrome/quinol oxidase subunit 2
MLKIIHSYWAYLVLLLLILSTANALIGLVSKREYSAKDFRISLATLITSHIQLLIGIVLYFTNNYVSQFSELGMGVIMKNSTLRSTLVEHPITMLIALALITVGYSKHKKKLTSKPKFKTLSIFYTIGLVLILSKIPWSTWIQ